MKGMKEITFEYGYLQVLFYQAESQIYCSNLIKKDIKGFLVDFQKLLMDEHRASVERGFPRDMPLIDKDFIRKHFPELEDPEGYFRIQMTILHSCSFLKLVALEILFHGLKLTKHKVFDGGTYEGKKIWARTKADGKHNFINLYDDLPGDLKKTIYNSLEQKWEVGFDQVALKFSLSSFQDCHTKYRYPHQQFKYSGIYNESAISTFIFIEIELDVMIECSLKYMEKWFVKNEKGKK